MRVSRHFLGRLPIAACLAALAHISTIAATAGYASAQRPPTDRHVSELAQYFNGVKIAAPIVVQGLAVYPVLVDDVLLLHGSWQTLDEAIARGTLVIHEKGSGSVPTVSVENRSKDTYILLMTGDVIKGGMQTRTVRHDTVLGPRQRIDLDVFCVEAARWEGGQTFSAGKLQAPQSIKGEIRGGGGQADVWSRVAENNAALGTENATHSLELAMKDTGVEKKLDTVRRRVVPEIPRGTVGFIFVQGGRAVGAEFFGSEALARAELPQFLDSYAIDYILRAKAEVRPGSEGKAADRVATSFFQRICRVGSERTNTAGSGAGIRTSAGGLLGDGVSLDSTLVHYGTQVARKVVPKPKMPPPNQYDVPDRPRLQR